MAERPLYTLYKNLKAQNYDVPDDYNKFESALTRDGKGGADNRHAIYENLKAQNFDVPSTYERFYSALFEPRSKTSSRAKGGSVPMSAADRARFSAGAAAISASAQQTMNNAGRYNRLKQRKQKQQKNFGRVNLGTHKTAFGGDANNVVKDDFAYNPETGKAGAYVTSDNENVYSLPEAEQSQAILDQQNNAYQEAVDTGEIPSAFDVRDKNGNYDLQENIGKNGTYLTEEGAQKQFDKKLADAYARKKEIEALIAEDNRQHGNPLLSYSASIGAGNGRTAEQSDYRNKLVTSLSLVTEQIGALEAVKQYPTSSWGEDALKALDNTAFTAKTWDFGLTDFATMGQMERIKTKMDNNIPLSGSDKMLLKSKLGADAAAALEDEKMGNVYRWTKIAGQSLPFMADFFLTGGYGGITKGISSGALKFAAKRGMGKVSAAILKNTGIVAGDVIGSYAMAGTEQALKTGADIMQRHLGNLYQDEKGDYKFGTFDENGNLLHEGGESMGTALYKGMTSAMVENYTEKLFGHNYGIKKGAVNFMEKHGMNASAEFFKNIGKSGWYNNSKKWMEKFGINGFGEEVMEEEIGIPLHALLDGDNKFSDLLDAKQQLDIIGGMAISVGSMYAMGAGSRPVKGIYNRAQYYRFRNKVNVADSDAQNLMGDSWADIKDKIDNATNEQMGSVLADILRQRDTMTKEQINAAVNYGVNLMKMRGYNIAKTAEMNAKEITNEPTTPEEQHQADIDNAYSEGHDADDADKHDIQIQQEDQMKTLAAALGISEQQLSAMSDEELESLTGQDDKLDQAIYDYQLSSARYQGVVDDAQDKVDLAAHQAEQRVDMYTDQSRGSVRNATIKASGGLEDYGVYIISGNIATHDDGSIDVSNSDDMILYYDPTTNSVEHADALMFAELGEELPADDVKAQAVTDAKENAIKETAGIIDGTVEVGSQFNVTDTDGTEHTYEVLADYGDGTAAISIDGNVVENPYQLADLQQMKDLEDQKRLEAAKAEREQMEKERAVQQTQETEQTQPSLDFNQILNDNGNVVLVDVLDKDGNTKYPDSKLFLIRDAGAKAKVVELKSDGTIVPHAVNKEDVATISSMSLDEYKQAMPESSMIEDNSGEESDEDSQLANLGLPKGSEIWMSGDGFGRPKENTLSRVVGIDEQGSIILEDKDGKKWSASFDYINNHRELPPLDENANIVNEENNQSESNADENTPAPEQTPAITLEDGTIVPMLEDGNPDFSKLTAAQTAELYDSQFGEDADSVISGWVSDAKKALDKASNMTVKGKTFVEQKAAKDAKEKAIADAQAAYDSAIAIRDAYNERQLAKVEDTAEGRNELIEKARRKFARLKSAVKDDAEAVAQIYKETVGTLLHRLYDGTGIDVTDTIPLTAEEYVASNLGAHSLNYEGTETSKGVKQETGLSREDFAKTQLLAADGKGTTIDALVHSLWENRPSNLESLDTQDIRAALLDIINSGFKASEARNFVENIRIAQAENILEEQKRAQENAAYAEQQKAEPEAESEVKSDEKAELKAKSEEKLNNESSNESNDLSNETDNENINDNINDNKNSLTPEQQKAKEEENTHSEAFNKIVDLAKKQKEYWDNPDGEMVDVAHEMDELLKTLSDEEFKEASDVLENMDEEFEYWTADEHERRENLAEIKIGEEYAESLERELKSITPITNALKDAVKSGDKKAIAKAQKKLTDALLASNLGHGYLSGQLEYAKSAKKKDKSYSERRALVKPLNDAINAIESALDSALAEAGLEGVHVDFNEGGLGWIYADKGSAWSSRLKPLDNDYRNIAQYDGINYVSSIPQITLDNVAKVAGIIKSQIEEGERYNSDEENDEENENINENINEQTKFPDKLREGSKAIEVPEDATEENPLGAQRDQTDLPFSAKENGKQQTTAERAADVEKNKVDDMKVVDNIVGEKTRKAFERLAKMMGANIQWQYSDKLGNGWIQETTDADGNVHRTIFITLDSSITKGAQFIFGHEMTHQIKNLNPAAYNELTQLVLDTYGSDAFDKAVDETMQRYSDAGFSGRARDYYAEEVVADAVGEMIRDLNLAHTLAMKMSHPLLAAIHEILQKIKLAFFGTEYSDVTKNIIRSIEQAYVKTANGQVINSETGEDVSFSLRQKPEPKKKGVGYKVFVLKDGKLYPPMVANPDGAATPVGVWLDADAAPIAGESKTGRPQVKQGGKGTQGGSGKLAYRPGWHLGVVPYAIQFNRKDAEGNKTFFPKNFVFAEVEYAADVDYQEEARQEGINPSGKYQHSLAGLKHLPTDGYYMYRTNPNPETDPWVITGAMKVNRILTRAEQAELVKNAGREPQQIQEGDIVTDDVVNSINQEIADAPKFSLKVYHGSGADFTEFDFDHMGEGAGSQVFGWGGYVTSSEEIGKSYANLSRDYGSRNIYKGDIPLTKLEKAALSSFIENNNNHEGTFKEGVAGSIERQKALIAKHPNNPLSNSIKKRIEVLEGAMPKLDSISWDDFVPSGKNLYEVDIPEDNGSNYLEWEKKPSDEVATKIIEGLYGLDAKTLDDMASKDIVFRTLLYDYIKNADKEQMIPLLVKTHALTRETTYDNGNVEDDIRFVYNRLSRWMGSQKAASQFLSSLGFTGIKYPAGTIMGGVEGDEINYVIFKPEDMRITEHTKFSLRLKSAIEETETNPSDAQKESGNYKKGHIKFGGYDYTIENPKGSTRSGKDADGKEWKVTMYDTYGYIRGKFGKDGDHLDMFINDKADLDNWDGDVFVVDQVNPDGSFDEHKVMYGYDSMDDAEKAYLANYSKGWKGLGNITGVSKDEFDKWLDSSNRKLKPFADYAKVKFSLKDNQGNPLNQDGTLKLDKIKSVDELTDEDFLHPTRNVELPRLPKKIADAIGTEGKPVVIKKNIFERNYMRHKDVTPELSKVIFKSALYNPDLYGQNQKKTRPYNWVLINTKDEKGNNRTILLEVNPNKDNVEIVHWHFVNDKNLGLIKKQAIREGDQVLILPSEQSEEVGGLSNLTDDLSAAKIDNSSETTKENGEKFSLKDEKTMFGMHNISVDKLRKAIKQGGFAAPSMGVVDSKNGIYSDYGEITLIPKAEKLAKRTGKNAGTFTADAWTPTYPQVERIMNKQGEKAFNTDMNVKLGDVDNGIYSNIRESWKGYLSSGDVRDGLYWHYLFDKGMNPETIYQTGKYDNDITNEVMRISDNGNKTDYTDKEVAELIQLMNKATGKDNDVDAQREKLKARIASAEKQGNHLLVALKKKRLEELEGVENFYIAADFVNDVVHNNRKNGKVDVHDTMDAAKEKVENDKKLSDDFPSWLDKKTEEYGVEEMLYNGTTPSGKPKYIPNTIENAVKLMKKQGVAGGYTAFGSELGVFIAKNSPEVNTLAAMKNAKDKLIPFGDERHNQIKDKITKEFLELSDEIRVGSNNRYAFDDSGVSRMVELTDHKGNEKEYLKKAYNVEVSDEWMDRYNKLLDTIKKDYKVFYLETKFMRPYGLDEFEKAIVPNDTPSDVVDALKNAGIDVSSYERGNAEDRQKVTMDAINSSDNIRFSLAGERGAAAADKAEERTFRMDNLSVARKMEEEKKDAKAIKMATGWERGADGKWRYEMHDAKIKDTMDVGGGHIVKRYEDDMLWNGGKLSKVIDAPELFKAYPQLKDVRIDTDAIMNDMPSNGEYNSKTNTITIHADELKYMNGILNHEIQHAIQDIEGFAKGGSPRLIRGEVKKKLNEVTKQIRQLRAEGKEDEAKALIEKNRGLYNAYQKNDDFNSYKSLAGEVEARNVSARLNMTPEERRKSLAESTEDVARKDQIFLGVGDVSFSLRDMADGKESGAADMAEDLKSLNTPDEVDDAIKTAIDDMPSGWQMANKKMIHIAQALGENRKAEIAGEEPKFSLKDGSLIKAGTYFSGGGLVEEGLKGIIDPVVAVEYDEKISGVYRNNFGQHIVTADVRDVDPKELVKQIDGEVEYFHASPVCKNYSQAKSNHAEVELDKETAASTAEFIHAIKPKVVTIENVKGYKDSDAMKTITDALDANGYTWDADVYNAADYGGYTNRERLIVRAVRDGKLPAKPKKMARKSGWYEAVADIIPTLTEKKNGVAPWMDIRLKADGIDWHNIDKPLYVMGSAYADGKIPHAFADELLPTLRTKSGDVIVMPDGKVYRAMGRVLARVSGVSDDYKMPFSENLSHTIIGNGIPTQLTEHVIAPLLQNTLHPTTPEDGNTKFSLRYDQFEHDLNQWKKDNNLPKDAQRPTIPQRNAGESAVDFLRRVDEYRKQMALWKTAPTYEQHLLSDDTALGEFNRELQRGSVLKRIAFQDSMLAIRKAQEAIMKEVGVDRLNMAEDAYTAENRSHGKGKNEFEEYNNEFLQPLRKAYHQMKKILGDSYDNVRIYMMAKHGLERDAQMAFKKSLEADYEDVAQRSAAYKAYKGDMNRIINDSDLEFGRVDFNTWRQRDNALREKYSPSYMNYRYDKNGIAYDYSGLSALFDGSDFEEAAHKLVRDIESSHVAEVQDLWNATNAATKKILRDGYKAGMMSKDTYQYVRDMYSHYIPLRGWDGTTADQVWDYIGGGKGAFNQTLKTANGRTSIADDPIAYIENMAESGILLNNKNWVKQHLMLLAQNHPTSLLTLSKAWYVKSTDANGNEEWIPATPQITSQMNSNQVKAAIDAFEKKMELMAQTGDATQKRNGLNIAYPQTHSEEREHEVRVMKDGEEYVIYVNGDPQLAQAMNNTRAHRVSEGIKNSISKRVIAVVGRKMAAAYTSLSPLFIPSNYFRDLTMTLASTAIREDAKYNYLLRKNLATSWNLGFMLRDYQNGKLREKVDNGNATPKEQMFYDFMMNGGETGFVSSLDVEDLKKKFKNDLKDLDRWKANPVKVGHTIMDSIEFLNRMIEDSNRFAVYMTSIQYGRSIDEAVNDAKDVTLNFNRKGTGEHSWQTIRNLYLFINPAVQSLQTLGALAKHHPFKFTAVTASWIASGVLVPIVNVALMQLGAAFLGGDGDDDKDWYKDLSKKYWQFSKWDRRNNFIMWVPTTHEFVKIPLAQEFRAFYGVGDMIASKMMGGELAEESWEDYGWDLVGQVVDMLPLDPTGYDGELGVSLMPNPIRPVFELAFNVDFTGKPLFKETEYNKYDPNFTKAYVGTPDWLVRASRMMNSIGNDYPDVQQNKWDALGNPRYNLNNPAVVDHVLSSYLGGAYTMGSQVLGLLTKSLNDQKKIKVADIPLVSKFVSNPDDRPVSKKQGDEFWDKKEYYDRASNTISKLKKQAKIDGDYSLLERFYGSEEYKTYKLYEKDVKDYKEARKKERAEESGDEYRPHQLNAEDIYNNHATPMDEFEDMKLKQLFEKLNSFKTRYDAIVDNATNESEGYYNTNKAAIDAIDEISLDKQEISELKKGFLDDGMDAYNAEDMKQIRELRKKILAVLEKANRVVVANQKAKAEK